MAPFNDLPVDVLERILHYVLQPDSEVEYSDHRSYPAWYWKSSRPATLLRNRLYSAFLDKQIYELALPAYFRTTRLSMVIGRNWSVDPPGRYSLVSLPPLALYKVGFGTFEEHALFFANSLHIRIELAHEAQERDMAIDKVYEVLVVFEAGYSVGLYRASQVRIQAEAIRASGESS